MRMCLSYAHRKATAFLSDLHSWPQQPSVHIQNSIFQITRTRHLGKNLLNHGLWFKQFSGGQVSPKGTAATFSCKTKMPARTKLESFTHYSEEKSERNKIWLRYSLEPKDTGHRIFLKLFRDYVILPFSEPYAYMCVQAYTHIHKYTLSCVYI